MTDNAYRHPALGFELTLPPGYSLLEESATDAMFGIAAEASPRPAIVGVAAEPIDAGLDTADYAERALRAAAAIGGPLRMLDSGEERLAERPAFRALFQRRDEHGELVVHEEHRLVHEGVGWTVCGICPVSAWTAMAATVGSTLASFRPPRQAPSLVRRPSFDPAQGTLVLSATELEALLQLAEGGKPDDDEALAALTEAGAVVDGAPHPVVASALDVMRAPTLELVLQRGNAGGRGWVAEDRAVMIVPTGGDRRQLTSLPRERLPEALADLVGLSPRPAPPERSPIETSVEELARLLAERPESPPGSHAADGGLPQTAAELVGGLRDHWRIDALSSDAAGPAMLEVLDGPGGYWLVAPEGNRIELRPTGAAELWAHLAELAAS